MNQTHDIFKKIKNAYKLFFKLNINPTTSVFLYLFLYVHLIYVYP